MTDERNTPRSPHHKDADTMSRDLASALRSRGFAMPRTEAEVAAAEAWLASQDVKLPGSLKDPSAVLNRRKGRILPLRPITQSRAEEVQESLARAARDGGVISPEVEQRMREDRERAERKRRGE